MTVTELLFRYSTHPRDRANPRYSTHTNARANPRYSTHTSPRAQTNDRAHNNLVNSQQQTPVFELGGGGGGAPLAPCPSVVTILQSLQHSNRDNTSMVTTPQPVQNFNRYNTQMATPRLQRLGFQQPCPFTPTNPCF